MKSSKFLRKVGIAAVIFTIFSMCISGVYALNLVKNGDFESGSTGWTEWNSLGTWTTSNFGHYYYNDCTGAIFIPDPCVYAGNQSHRQQVGTQNVHGGIYQVIDVKLGKKYRVSGYWSGGVGGAGNNNNDFAWLEVTIYQGTVGVDIIDVSPRPHDVIIAKKDYSGLSDTVTFNWEPFSVSHWYGGDGTFVSQENTVTLAIKVGKVGEWNYMANYVDNITVGEVPGTNVFDTRSFANPYPSISGTHNGTIRPNETITVQRLYTYPCPGTGGHTEYASIAYSNGTVIAEAYWNGYIGDWRNLSFNKSFTLYANETYYYTIKTGSYPQIIHASSLNAIGGVITCEEFEDFNGKRHEGWIPAILLE